MPKKPMARHEQSGGAAFPTVLVAVCNDSLRQKLVDELSRDRCHVLHADTTDTAISLVITHSRPIHVVLIGVMTDPHELGQVLRCYRPNLNFVFVTADSTTAKEGVNLAHVALSNVRELLGVVRGANTASRAAVA